jgi:hypothetical protein
MTFDLEAATEEALPPSSLALIASQGAPPTASSPPPKMTPPPGSGSLPRAHEEEADDESSSELTRRMSRPPTEPSDIFEEETQLSPASQGLPRADPVSSAPPDPMAISSQRHTRPTVLSPILAPAVPPTLETPTAGGAPRGRTIPLRTAVIGLVAALAVGTAVGFEAHRLLSPSPPPHHVGAHR